MKESRGKTTVPTDVGSGSHFPDIVIPDWAAGFAASQYSQSVIVEHVDELRDYRLCGWLFLDEHDAFWTGISVGKRLASGGSDA